MIKPITLCNIYKPPRNNNNNANIVAFLDLYAPVITAIARGNTDAILAGDLNINLLKIREREKFAEYLHLMVNNSLIPKINLPTRFAKKNASLIDHMFCKMTSNINTNDIKSGILVNNTSDHFATFIFIKTNTKPKPAPKYVKIQTKDELSMNKFCQELSNTNISETLDLSETADPNTNHNILEKTIINAKEKHLPIKIKKFNKYKHKLTPWITTGIINSIHFRDNLHKIMKCTPCDSISFNNLQHNLRVYNKILKQNIRLAKQKYYHDLFVKFQNNIKKTWDTIKEIMNRCPNKKSIPESLIINNSEINDKVTIVENSMNSSQI